MHISLFYTAKETDMQGAICEKSRGGIAFENFFSLSRVIA